MKSTINEILILGMGNEILCDDAIGVKIIDDLMKRIDNSGIDFIKMSVGGLEIVELIQNYKLIIVIDSLRSESGIPGKVYCFGPESFKETHHLTSLHDISFLSALKLVNELYDHSPHKLAILAIEVLEDKFFCEKFSPEIEYEYPNILKQIEKHVIILLEEYKTFYTKKQNKHLKNNEPHLTK